jgi:predicted nucleic acid-binding protein
MIEFLTRRGLLEPMALRSLDAIHLATARLLGEDLGQVVTYDDRMADAARSMGLTAASPQ